MGQIQGVFARARRVAPIRSGSVWFANSQSWSTPSRSQGSTSSTARPSLTSSPGSRTATWLIVAAVHGFGKPVTRAGAASSSRGCRLRRRRRRTTDQGDDCGDSNQTEDNPSDSRHGRPLPPGSFSINTAGLPQLVRACGRLTRPDTYMVSAAKVSQALASPSS